MQENNLKNETANSTNTVLGVVCPKCKTEPKFRRVETVTDNYHWAYECNCHSQVRADKDDAKEKYWLWYPSNNA